MISVGMSTGAICNFVMDIESRNYFDEEEEMKMSGASDQGQHNPIAKLSVKEQRSYLSNEGNLLASASYLTSITDTPVLDT
jgi:hypothetical protein